MEHIYKTAFNVEDRRSARHALAFLTYVRELGGSNVPIILHDISGVGFSGDCPTPFTIPTLVSINIPPAGEVKARIIWLREGKIGGEFLHKLGADQLAEIVAHRDAAANKAD